MQTELIHLYDLDFKGCRSCYACKRKGAKVEHCVIKDGLYPVLQAIVSSDAVIIGTPFYFWDFTAATRALLERLLYPYFNYDNQPNSFPRKVSSALFCTMGIPEQIYDLEGPRYQGKIEDVVGLLANTFGSCESLVATDTMTFDDYSQYATSMFDPEQKKRQYETVFPQQCAAAFAIGASFGSDKNNHIV
jgi:multimeric flavodoxin WrbA